ncbi:MAG: hypothetical protein EP332_09715 [Bacteroidetes bacterium]|nr:MAG: hypothetical protein EP332_09715 [Bacteroidota bacterium]
MNPVSMVKCQPRSVVLALWFVFALCTSKETEAKGELVSDSSSLDTFNFVQSIKYFGTFSTLDTFLNAGFELKYAQELDTLKFQYLYNTNTMGAFGTDPLTQISLLGVACIYTNAQWKVFEAYYKQIDSIYLLDTDGTGNLELAVKSSERAGAFLGSCGCGWELNDSTLEIIHLDSNALVFSATTYFYNRQYSNSEMEEWDFELTSSATIHFSNGRVRVSESFCEFSGDAERVDKESQECVCPENGEYVLRNGPLLENY